MKLWTDCSAGEPDKLAILGSHALQQKLHCNDSLSANSCVWKTGSLNS